MVSPLVSICIPCYKNVEKVKRLLESIRIQLFTQFEIILTDDSPDDYIKHLVHSDFGDLNINYYKNSSSLGSPENWNKAISLANGTWIKIMHHDDYFTDANSLQHFMAYTQSGAQFIFSNYTNLHLSSGKKEEFRFPKKKLKKILQNPMILNAKNLIGNPSCTLIHKSYKSLLYDKRFIWKVDIEYYINLIKNGAKLYHIDKSLIVVGISKTQITNEVKLNPKYEIPESFLLLEKYGFQNLNNIWVYDSYWRTFRNLGIYDIETLQKYQQGEWGASIEHILNNLKKSNIKLLKNGVYSKIKMLYAYMTRPK